MTLTVGPSAVYRYTWAGKGNVGAPFRFCSHRNRSGVDQTSSDWSCWSEQALVVTFVSSANQSNLRCSRGAQLHVICSEQIDLEKVESHSLSKQDSAACSVLHLLCDLSYILSYTFGQLVDTLLKTLGNKTGPSCSSSSPCSATKR